MLGYWKMNLNCGWKYFLHKKYQSANKLYIYKWRERGERLLDYHFIYSRAESRSYIYIYKPRKEGEGKMDGSEQ